MSAAKFRTGLVVVSAAVLAAAFYWWFWRPDAATSYTRLLGRYASLLTGAIAGARNPGFVVIAAAVDYPPGTVLVVERDPFASCPIPPTAFPAADRAVTDLPPIGDQASLVVTASLPEPIKAVLDQPLLRAGGTSSVSLGFAGLRQHLADEDPFTTALESPVCAEIIARARQRHPGSVVTIIRGTYIGRQRFLWDVSLAAKAGLEVEHAGAWDVELDHGRAVAMDEARPRVHFLATYTIGPEPAAPASGGAAPDAAPPRVTAPPPAARAPAPRQLLTYRDPGQAYRDPGVAAPPTAARAPAPATELRSNEAGLVHGGGSGLGAIGAALTHLFTGSRPVLLAPAPPPPALLPAPALLKALGAIPPDAAR